MKFLLLIIFLCSILSAQGADSITVWKHKTNVRIVSAKHPTKLEIKFQAIPKKDKMRAILSFDSY